MKKHTSIYLKHFGYDTSSWIACEVCGAQAVDIHHIEARSMGGSKTKDTIENLMAVCRACHIEKGDKKQYKEELKAVHQMALSKVKTK
jgi:5-methylcytosine-specific restriction endonuclease McrA